MSAPSIPNLLSLRGQRGGLRGRGRGRGGGSAISNDAVILNTDNDAAVSRLSAVDLGYLDDSFARYFVRASDGPPPRRLPIINRGTYTRTIAIDSIVDAFLTSEIDPHSNTRQVISLGAGTDTRALRLFSQPRNYNLIYHEIDFEQTSSAKFRTVQGVPALAKILTDLARDDSSSWSSSPAPGNEYHCHGFDLRGLSDATSKIVPGLRTDVPTLLISECCLCYMGHAEASQILSFFTSRIPTIGTVIYEPIRPHDAFGKVMTSNLAARHISMPTLQQYPEPEDQRQRLKTAGFKTAKAMTIEDIWDKWVASEEKERLDRVEGLDEVEEWKLLAAHYIVAWGSTWEGTGLWQTNVGAYAS
ncbi:hypothetical protein NLU13_0529 [Sarocladium strictum]|uniref:Leucine carboxyl methyltransferase 1 n=1 Tax=Sarocladium strictum TaxID=5046 RepID=A0AA39GP82_SARSR|nr:hypothetical protein NLU13_0529 [Sarocladium strictum]